MSPAIAKTRYGKLETERNMYLDEAFRSAKVTLPSVIPENTDIRNRSNSNHIRLAKPFQSLGARGVNNLASKLLLTLLPPTHPFFRYEISPKILEEIEADDQAGVAKAALDQQLAKREREIVTMVETLGIRVKMFLVLKHLLIAGNALVVLTPKDGMQVFPLNSYVAKRDPRGRLVEFIYVESFERATLQDEEIIRIVESAPEQEAGDQSPSAKDSPIHVYTHVRTEGDTLFVRKEVLGQQVGEIKTFPVDDSPFMVLRYTAIDGEDYGRGFVEEYRGDLTSLEELSKDLIFAAGNAAKMIPLIRPNGTLKLKAFAKAQNGEPLHGEQDDVFFARVEKSNDMAVAAAQQRDLKQDLAADFLLNSSFQRNAERVTAEEIRRMAEELEDALGGAFSILSQDFQLPLARRLEAMAVREGTVPKLPPGSVTPAIVTGLAAIGRGQDQQLLRDMLAMVIESAPAVPDLPRYLEAGEVAKRIATTSGLDTDGLVKSKAVVEQEIEQERQLALQTQMATDAVKGAAGPVAAELAGPLAEQQGLNTTPQES